MWLLRFVLSASLCVTAAQRRGDWEQSEVRPVRLDPQSQALTAEEREKDEEMRVYRLDVFGQRIILKLEPDHTFLAPGFVFHVVGGAERGTPTTAQPDRGCFYSGKVNQDEPSSSTSSSAAALNLCHGLRGGFYHEGREYFIQPRNESDYFSAQDEDVHVVRRWRRERESEEEEEARGTGGGGVAQEGGSKCGVNEDEARVPRNLERGASHGADNGEQTGERRRAGVDLETNVHGRMSFTRGYNNLGTFCR